MTWTPHEAGCVCCETASRDGWNDVWAGNPDTDKYWAKVK